MEEKENVRRRTCLPARMQSADKREAFITPPHIYKGLSGKICVRCTKQVLLNVHLKIRHGSSLLLKNIVWKIAGEYISSAVLGGPVLKSIILEAACGQNNGEIAVNKALKPDEIEEEDKSAEIAAMFGDSIFMTGATMMTMNYMMRMNVQSSARSTPCHMEGAQGASQRSAERRLVSE